jgi:hypothetical protein
MSLEPNLLVGTYLAGIGTALFVIAINLFAGRNDKEKTQKSTITQR